MNGTQYSERLRLLKTSIRTPSAGLLSSIILVGVLMPRSQSLADAVSVDGGASLETVQAAIDGLPADRDFVATVKMQGEFRLDGPIVLPSHTRLDLSEAFIELTDGSAEALITNADHEAGNTRIEVRGGRLQGPGRGGEAQGILFIRVSDCSIEDIEVANFPQDGIRLSGHGRHTRRIRVNDLLCRDNGNSGLNLMWAVREVQVSNVLASGNLIGLRSDHSEGSYVNVTADSNRKWGIFVRNVFGNHYANMTAARNGAEGIYVLGMVSSSGTSWRAHNNGQDKRDTPADIVFSRDDQFSYGTTAASIVSGISAGSYPQYGGRGPLPYGIYFEGTDGDGGSFDQVRLVGGTTGETAKGFLRLPPGGGVVTEELPE